MGESGYAVVRKFLPKSLLDSLETIKALAEGSAPRVQPHLGTVTGIEQSAHFASIILFDQQYELLEEMGFADSRFFTGYFISKPPGNPKLHWHQDWWGWSDPISYGEPAPVVYLMYYLTHTDRSNGCLRVLPGSHIRHNELHELLGDRPTHPAELLTATDVSLSTRPDEVEVPVSAGDLIVRDGRLLHASHANLSTEDRDLFVRAGMAPPVRAVAMCLRTQAAEDRPFMAPFGGRARFAKSDRLSRHRFSDRAPKDAWL
jgi:hypothetical protein